MQLGTEPITEKHLQWADKIIVMEEKHREFIRSISKEKVGAKLTVLGIPDIYEYNQKELIALLEEKVDSIINPSL